MRHRTLLVVAVFVIGCGKRSNSRGGDAGESSSVLVRIRVDGDEVASLDREALRARPRLDALLPEDDRDPTEWTHVGAATADRRELSLWQPAETRADQEIVLYLDGEQPAIGAFRAAPPGASPELRAELARPRVALVGIERVDVATVPPPAAPREQLAITVDGAAVAIDLAAIARTPVQHGGGGGQRAVWSLGDVVGAAAPGAQVVRVRVTGSEALVLDAADLAAAELRINRRGELGVDLRRAGTRTRGPRGVRQLDVETARTPR